MEEIREQTVSFKLTTDMIGFLKSNSGAGKEFRTQSEFIRSILREKMRQAQVEQTEDKLLAKLEALGITIPDNNRDKARAVLEEALLNKS